MLSEVQALGNEIWMAERNGVAISRAVVWGKIDGGRAAVSPNLTPKDVKSDKKIILSLIILTV